MNARQLTAAAIAASITTLVGVAAAAPASAKDGRVQATGTCTTSGQWKIKASPEGSRIELQLEVQAPRPGQRWTVAVTDNGVRIITTSRTSSATSQFSVRSLVANRAGTDHFVATARNTVTGNTCRAVVNYPG